MFLLLNFLGHLHLQNHQISFNPASKIPPPSFFSFFFLFFSLPCVSLSLSPLAFSQSMLHYFFPAASSISPFSFLLLTRHGLMVKRANSGARLPWFSYLPVVWPWTCYLTSLFLFVNLFVNGDHSSFPFIWLLKGLNELNYVKVLERLAGPQ